MRLKKIVIHGFKSFADRTVVEFHKGITAIVGPNGCGKSNISDAFRWVMGEQSAKSIRGNKMHDVIFAGTAGRRPLNVAEVTLTLTDIQGSLPVEYEEVSITRRLHRSGESEYLLNNNPVRLRDIQGLFLDSGVGKNSFSIFEQGKIDEVINLNPVDRRTIFEEAAGILRFLQRKRETLRKLKATDENVTRIRDIHQEVEKQIHVLEKQVEAAQKFKANKSELRDLERAVAVAKWELSTGKLNELQEKRTASQEKLKATIEQSAELRKNLGEAREQLEGLEQLFRERSEKYYQTKSTQALKAQEKESNTERAQEAGKRWERLQKELKEIHSQRSTSKGELEKSQKQRKQVEERFSLAERRVEESRNAVAKVEEATTKLRENYQKAQQDRVRALQEESQTNAELQQLAVRLETSEERVTDLGKKWEIAGEKVAHLTEGLAEYQQEVDQCKAAVDKQKQKQEALDQELQRTEGEVKQLQEKQETLVRKAAEVQARYQALQNLQKEMEGFSSGAKQLLQASADASSPIHGKVQGIYEVIRPKRGEEHRVAAVMRPYTQTLVVEKRTDFNDVLCFAAKEGLTDYSLICLEDCEKIAEGHSSLSEAAEDHALARHLLGNVYKVSSIDDAWTLLKEGKEALTPEDFYLDHHGVLFQTSPGEQNVFLREAEIQSLTETLEKLLVEQETNEKAVDALYQRRVAIEAERATIDKAVRSGEMRLVEVNFALQRAKSDLEMATQEQARLQEEQKQLQSEQKQLRERIALLKQRYEELEALVKKLEGALASTEEELEQQQAVLQEKRQNLLVTEEEFRRATEAKQELLHLLNLLELQDTESEKQEVRIARELEALADQQKKAKSQDSTFEQELKEVQKVLAQLEAAYQETEKQLKRKKAEIETIEAKARKEEERIRKVEEEAHQFGLKIAQLESSIESVVNDLQERHQLTIPEAQELKLTLPGPIDECEKRIRYLRRDVDKTGNVNLASIDEFERNKARHAHLQDQISDMEGSKDELLAIIKELDTKSRKIFKEVFAEIRANFQKNFKILFRGGEADLTFTEVDDVLEAGIEIVAKPPGKQMRSISLLSGGEKCLTAMALLFAIFEVKSAPFCILDEIDAPLDDSNISRFVNVVKQFVDRSQFIIITHNKRTMAIADRIFGVSMEERGVSKLLSMEFHHEKEEEEEIEEVMVSQV